MKLNIFQLKILISVILYILLAFFLSCSGDKTAPDQPGQQFPESELSYTLDIRPIFLRDCASFGACHQSASRAGGLDLATDLPDFMGNSGLAVIPTYPEQSNLFNVLLGPVPLVARQMPPEPPFLTENEITAIRTWIQEGAYTTR